MSLEIAKTIHAQLSCGGQSKVRMMCWGTRNFIGGDDFLMFQVSGLKFKGKVKIVYKPCPDVYEVEFYKKGKLEPVHTITDVYCDELNVKIDDYVEKIDSYSF